MSGNRENTIGNMLDNDWRRSPLLLLLISAAGLSGFIFGFFPAHAGLGIIFFAILVSIISDIKLGVFFLLATSALTAAKFTLFSYQFAHFFVCHLIVILLLIVFIWKKVKSKSPSINPTSIDAPLILLFLISILSIINSYIFWDSQVPFTHRHLAVQAAGSVLILFSIGIFFVIKEEIKSSLWIKKLYFLLLLITFIPALLSMPRKILGIDIFNNPLSKIDFGILYIIGLALTYAAFLYADNTGLRFKYAAAAGIFLFALFSRYYSGMRTLPAALVVILVISFLRSKKLFAVLLLLAVFLGLGVGIVLSFDLPANDASSLHYRLIIWKNTFNVLKQHWSFWFLGVGTGNYYAYSLVYTINAVDAGAWGLTTPHSQYLTFLGESGFIGLFCFFWFIINTVKLEFQMFSRAKDNFSRAFYSGAAGAFIGILTLGILADSLLPSISNQGFLTICVSIYTWILLGLVFSQAGLDQKRKEIKK